jgi:hypothetical protein
MPNTSCPGAWGAASDIFAMLIKRHPEAGAALHESDTATVRGFLDEVKADAEAAISIRRTLDEGKADMIRRLAANTNLSEAEVSQLQHYDQFRDLDTMWKDAMNDAGAGHAFPGAEEVKTAVSKHIDALFADKIKTWRELMRLDLSQQLIQEWQTRTLSSPRLNLLEDFQDSCAIGSAVDAQGLAAALAQPNVSTEELSVLLLSVCRRLDHEFHTLLADKFGNMDSFATERISVLSTQAFLDRNPALREAFAQGPDKGRAVYGKFEKRATEINRAISRGQGDMDTLVEELGFVSKGMLILHHALGMDENA